MLCLVNVCGQQEFNAETDIEKIIHPPAHPAQYYSAMSCWYTIVGPNRTRIRFWIADLGSQKFNSDYFYIKVRTNIKYIVISITNNS